MKTVAERKREENLERARAIKSVKGVKIKRVKIKRNHGIDPELARRRLLTLIRLLQEEAAGKFKPRRGELTPHEMTEWAQQCRNLVES